MKISLLTTTVFIVLTYSLSAVSANLNLPFFIPVLVKQNNLNQVRTLSSYELSLALPLHPEISDEATLESQVQLQLTKLARLMPVRAARMLMNWNALSPKLDILQRHLTIPPGIPWSIWLKPHDEDLMPAAVSSLNPDGSWLIFLDEDLYPKLAVIEKAQVIMQLLWAHDLQTQDNLQVRTISNYLFSTEWNQFTTESLIPVLRKLEIGFFESSGFCFKVPAEGDIYTAFYADGKIKNGMASDQCQIYFHQQNLIFTAYLKLSPTGNIIGDFSLVPETPWHLKLSGEDFIFLHGQMDEGGFLKAGLSQLFSGGFYKCLNTKNPSLIRTQSARISSQCLKSISFHPDGTVASVSNALVTASVQGKTLEMGLAMDQNGGGPLTSFFEDGSIQAAFFPAGTTLQFVDKNNVQRTVTLIRPGNVNFNRQGFAIH